MKCENIGLCGGCTFRDIDYDNQLKLKQDKVKNALEKYFDDNTEFQNIVASPLQQGYRNKMEFSFGDNVKNGPLTLGLHQKKSFYNILNANNCDLVTDDIKEVISKTLKYFSEKNINYFHKRTFKGYLRNLVVRKSFYENRLLINLVTTSDYNNNYIAEDDLLNEYVNIIKNDNIAGILHTINNQVSDCVKCEKLKFLYGEDFLTEKICGIYFKISPFSFFQTNSLCAEKLYEKIKQFAIFDNEEDNKKTILYDLFCGTGTISQIMSKEFSKTIGVEIVEEAVEKAIENAKINNIDNAIFLSLDVNKFIDDIVNNNFYIDSEKITINNNDVLILDPPREGIIEKTLNKILSLQIKKIVYVSCKLASFERDLLIFKNEGYKLIKVCPVDMFPWTDNVETVGLLCKDN